MKNKNFFNAIVYDIINWSFNFVSIAFLWSIDHKWCVALVGLYAMRIVANFIYERGRLKEQEAMMKKGIEQFEKMLSTKSSFEPDMFNDFNEDEDLEEKKKEPSKKDYIQ